MVQAVTIHRILELMLNVTIVCGPKFNPIEDESNNNNKKLNNNKKKKKEG